MGYKDRRKQALKKELRGMSATGLYELGSEIYDAELRERQIYPRGSAPLTVLGKIALDRYQRGEPNRKLP